MRFAPLGLSQARALVCRWIGNEIRTGCCCWELLYILTESGADEIMRTPKSRSPWPRSTSELSDDWSIEYARRQCLFWTWKKVENNGIGLRTLPNGKRQSFSLFKFRSTFQATTVKNIQFKIYRKICVSLNDCVKPFPVSLIYIRSEVCCDVFNQRPI